jgi:hypothetical protein
MIVRNAPDGTMVLIGQTEHSKLVGQFGAHWGNAQFEAPRPFTSVARAATFHDFGWLRYETDPQFDERTGSTPAFRDVATTVEKLAEYRWCFDWLLAHDAYAGHLVSMHRTGLWRGRYDAILHPAHPLRQQSPDVEAFVTEQEVLRAQEIVERGWDVAEMRTNFRLLQVWDLLGLYFTCGEPYPEHIEPVPSSYADGERVGATLTLTPLDARRVRVTPYPFGQPELHVQFTSKRLPMQTYASAQALTTAYFQAPVELTEFVLV